MIAIAQGSSPPWKAWFTALPLTAYVLILIVVIGLFLCLSGDFGRSWDVTGHENNGAMAFTYYFEGFDSARFRTDHADISYGPVVDLLIKFAQDVTADPLKRFEIRVFLQALLTFSSLIPIFLISARVVSRPLALIPVALIAATPAFFGHAFINPKDNIVASGVLWCFWLILYCFEGGRRPRYLTLIGLGTLLGLTASIRYLVAYLLVLAPLAAIALPALRREQSASSESLAAQLQSQFASHYRGLAVLLLIFAVTYTAFMPVILTDFGLGAYLAVIGKFAHIGWGGSILYFGREVPAQNLPWHYLYGYMLVQLPLHYHLFLATLVALAVGWPRRTWQTLREFYDQNDRAATTVILLLVAVIVPLVLISVTQPVFYDGFRHVLFLVPLLCLLLFFGIAIALPQIGDLGRGLLVALATLCWVEAVVAMRSLHPYE
jgi:4-amino-4-deoxy-L-arabinose transferase-like glycosyltransferase